MRCAALTFALIALITAATGARAAAGDPDQIYVGFTTIQPFDQNEPPELRIDYLVLFPEGLALRAIPEDGLEYDNVERFAQKHGSKVGRYVRTPTALTIEWGRKKRKQTWDLVVQGRNLTLNEDTIFQPAPRVTRDYLKGIWKAGSAMMTRNVTGGSEFIFRSNGEYERGGGDGKRGRYELDGYKLTLYARDGSVHRHAIYRWPWAAGAIGIDERMYQLLQSRRQMRD
jgi:hypothetical protein